jgi:hypothetical protein
VVSESPSASGASSRSRDMAPPTSLLRETRAMTSLGVVASTMPERRKKSISHSGVRKQHDSCAIPPTASRICYMLLACGARAGARARRSR